MPVGHVSAPPVWTCWVNAVTLSWKGFEMKKSTVWAEGCYEEQYREVAGRVSGATKKGGNEYVRVDVPGLEGVFAFPVGGLSVIVGWPGAGKSVLCDNLVAKAQVPVAYFPLQSTSLESAHVRLCAVEAGINYCGAVAGHRTTADRIAIADASERLLDRGTVLVCLDEVMPSLFNDVLVDIIGESTERSGSIDEKADTCLVVLDNVDMLAADGAPLWQRIQFLKDVTKGTQAALVVAVAGDYDELWSQLANADEVYRIDRLPAIAPAPAERSLGKVAPSQFKKAVVRNEKTSRHDGHPVEVAFEIDLPTRTIRKGDE